MPNFKWCFQGDNNFGGRCSSYRVIELPRHDPPVEDELGGCIGVLVGPVDASLYHMLEPVVQGLDGVLDRLDFEPGVSEPSLRLFRQDGRLLLGRVGMRLQGQQRRQVILPVAHHHRVLHARQLQTNQLFQLNVKQEKRCVFIFLAVNIMISLEIPLLSFAVFL